MVGLAVAHKRISGNQSAVGKTGLMALMSFTKSNRRRYRALSMRRLPACVCLPLEPRLFLDAAPHDIDELPLFDPPPDLDANLLHKSFRLKRQNDPAGDTGLAIAANPLSSIPILNSNPTAIAKVYLDFDGEPATNWDGYSVSATPAYDTDGDPSTFSDGELANIQQIWARVSEKYAPFNVNITTVNPGVFADRVAEHVVIGGNGVWTGGTYGGVAMVGSFSNSYTNTVWIFEDNLGNGDPHYTAEAASHEAGHGFGLEHQSSYDANGTKTAEYNLGDSLRAPTMGNSYYSARGLWWYGTNSVSSTTYQDDMAVISGSNNAFGYRIDDYSDSSLLASPLLLNFNLLSGNGIIQKTTDRDWFSFTAGAGLATLTASVVTGATLDLKLELYDISGNLLASADTSSLGESISMSLPAGPYRLLVASHGGYGDVGQYSISGTIAPPPQPPLAPVNLTATSVALSQIALSWQDRSTNETGFTVQRSSDGGAHWDNLATTLPNVTSAQDNAIGPTTTYLYRVFANGTDINSDFSNTLSVTPVPAVPGEPAASPASSTQINLSWTDVTGETGYRIDRSLDGQTEWQSLVSLSANQVTYSNTALLPGNPYYYRVVATGLAADSAPSATASAATYLAGGPVQYTSFPSSSGLTLNGSAGVVNPVLRVTTNRNTAGSAFVTAAQNVQRFSANFDLRTPSGSTEGCTFTIQGVSASVLGGTGSGLGFAGLVKSVAVKFDTRNSSGEGTSSTGLYINGAAPTLPCTNLLTSNVDLASGHVIHVTLDYDGATLQVNIRDTVTGVSAAQSYTVDIPAVVQSSTAWVGFTGSTGNATVTQEIQAFTYIALPATAPVASMTGASLGERTTQVPSLGITFTQAVSGFDLSDLTLTRDGIAVSLGAASLSSSDGLTWTLGNLSGLTDRPGAYLLTLRANGSLITAASGRLLPTGTSTSWVMTGLILPGSGTTVRLAHGAGSMMDVFLNGNPGPADYAVNISGLSGLAVLGTAGNDTLILDETAGDPLPAGGASFDGGAGQDLIRVLGGGSPTQVTLGASSLTVAGKQTLFSNTEIGEFDGGAGNDVFTESGPLSITPVFNGGAGIDTLVISGGLATLPAGFDASVESLSATGNAVVTLASANLQSLSIGATAKVKLATGGGGYIDFGRTCHRRRRNPRPGQQSVDAPVRRRQPPGSGRGLDPQRLRRGHLGRIGHHHQRRR